jgi:hypothetical protein
VAFTIARHVPVDAPAAWDAVADLAAHGRFVPFTDVHVPADGLDLGAEVVALTRLGPLAVADRMLVTAHEPGRRLRLVKTGRLLRGWADIVVVAAPGGGAHVRWTEELWLPGLRRPTRPVGDLLGPRLFGPVVDGVLAAARRPGSGG